MNQRILGKTGRSVSEIGLGTWQLGTRWGDQIRHKTEFRCERKIKRYAI